MEAKQPNNLLRRFFSGLAEQTFEVRLGVVDPPLIDYLSGLLIRCVRHDALHRVRGASGRPLRELDRMVTEASARIGSARRTVHRHIGDFALFWAGLFPEALSRASGESELDRFGAYCAQGKRAYLIASSIDTDVVSPDRAPSDVLQRLGLHFEMCAYGLREVRREWETQDDWAPPPTLS